MPSAMAAPYPMEFVRRGEDIVLRIEEYDAERVIRMNADGNTDALRYVYYHSDHPTASRRNTLYREIATWSGASWDYLAGGGQLFLENIQNLTLTYQMADGTSNTAPANLENIRGVVINLVAQTAYAVEPYEGGKRVRTRQLISNIQIRNLGLS